MYLERLLLKKEGKSKQALPHLILWSASFNEQVVHSRGTLRDPPLPIPSYRWVAGVCCSHFFIFQFELLFCKNIILAWAIGFALVVLPHNFEVVCATYVVRCPGTSLTSRSQADREEKRDLDISNAYTQWHPHPPFSLSLNQPYLSRTPRAPEVRPSPLLWPNQKAAPKSRWKNRLRMCWFWFGWIWSRNNGTM